MRKTTALALGTISTLASASIAAAAIPAAEPVPQARSFAELLEPIANAPERLALADEADARLIETSYGSEHPHHSHPARHHQARHQHRHYQLHRHHHTRGHAGKPHNSY